MLATDLAVLDHSDGTVLLIANAINYDATDERVDEAWSDAVARLDAMTADLAVSASVDGRRVDRRRRRSRRCSRTERADFLEAVERGQGGDPGGGDLPDRRQPAVRDRLPGRQPRRVPGPASASNPSPYMYLLRFDGFDIVGSSPEALVKVDRGQGDGAPDRRHPVARRDARGRTPPWRPSCSADEKERAEHLMLVDLARNDLGRVCRPGTVEVVDFMTVERYSHVMHIVSTVVGEVAAGPYGVRRPGGDVPGRHARRVRRRCGRWS